MIPPYELAKKEFKKALHGYNTSDVHEHLDFIISKYTELYDAYNDLEEKFASLEAEFASLKRSEDNIRRALVNAQNSGAKILKDANDRSSFILRAAQDNCDKILHEFRQKVKDERSELFMLKNSVAQFKKQIFSEYQQHLEYLEKISPDYDVEEDKWNLSDKDLVTKAVSQIMFDVSEAEKNKADEEAKAKASSEKAIALSNTSGVKGVAIDDSTLEDLVNNKGSLVGAPTSDSTDDDDDGQPVINVLGGPKIEVSEEEANLFKEILGD